MEREGVRGFQAIKMKYTIYAGIAARLGPKGRINTNKPKKIIL
jgi:hypothetical protein